MSSSLPIIFNQLKTGLQLFSYLNTSIFEEKYLMGSFYDICNRIMLWGAFLQIWEDTSIFENMVDKKLTDWVNYLTFKACFNEFL